MAGTTPWRHTYVIDTPRYTPRYAPRYALLKMHPKLLETPFDTVAETAQNNNKSHKTTKNHNTAKQIHNTTEVPTTQRKKPQHNGSVRTIRTSLMRLKSGYHSFFPFSIANQKSNNETGYFVFHYNAKHEKMPVFSYFTYRLRSKIRNGKKGTRTEFHFNIQLVGFTWPGNGSVRGS